MSSPDHSFRLYLHSNSKGPYYQCQIFDTVSGMRRAGALISREYGRPKSWKKANAATIHFPHERQGHQVGVVYLSRNNLVIGTISHELTHAAFYVEGDADEPLAWLQGWLMTQFFTHLKNTV